MALPPHPTQIYDDVRDYMKAMENGDDISTGRVLSLDIGSKWIGVARSDTRRVIASPDSVYERKSFAKDHAHIQKMIHDYDVGLVVAGLPLNLDGSLSRQGESIYHYCLRLWDESPLHASLIFWDERFSSNAVDRAMIAHDMTRKKREERIDKLAATYMLQGVLDFFAHSVAHAKD